MPTLTERAHSNGQAARSPGGLSAWTGPGRRRLQLPWVVAGVVLVAGCALAFAVVSVRVSSGTEVLAVAKPVAAGQALSASDLRVVRLSEAAGLSPVTAASEASVLGRPAAVALVPGALLVSGEVGAPPSVAAGTRWWPWR